MPWQGVPLEEALPTCQPGDAFTVDEIRLVERQTGPPDYLTEAELITLMEKHGIGTDTRLAETGRASELCRVAEVAATHVFFSALSHGCPWSCRDGRQHPRPHQQHLPEELRYRGDGPPAQAH